MSRVKKIKFGGYFVLHKIFVTQKISGTEIIIANEEFKHIKALRLNLHDKIVICNGKQKDYFCEIKTINDNNAVLSINYVQDAQTEPIKKIILFQALPKSDKFELVIQKATELGVNNIFPVITDNCDIKKNPSDNKILRWKKIAKSAAEQSGRGIIPEISNIINFEQAIISSKNFDLNLIAHEKSDISIKKFLDHDFKNKYSIGIFIGPEGGFSKQEVLLAQKNNIHPISLGKRILRTETASIFILSAIIFQSEL